MQSVKLTIRLGIVFLLSSLILAASVTVLIVSYIGSKNSIHSLVDTLSEEMTSHVTDKTKNHLAPGIQIAELSTRLIYNDLLDPEDRRFLKEYFQSTLNVYSQFAMLYYGDTAGNFFMLKRMSDGSFSTKTVTRQQDIAYSLWQHQNREWVTEFPDLEEPIDIAYDPRKRPWYQQAVQQKKIAWTNVYIFFSDKQPGISASTPIYDSDGVLQGVIGVDISLADLSQFVGKLDIGRTGKAFIVDDQQRIIAIPVKSVAEVREKLVDIYFVDGQKKYRPLTLMKLKNTALSQSFDLYTQHRSLQSENYEIINFSFDYQNRKHLASFYPLAGDSGLNWHIGVVVPEEDFMEPIYQNNRTILMISLILIVGAVLVGIFLSRRISGPLSELSQAMQEVKDFKLDPVPHTPSFLQEVDDMVTSFENMKTGLRSFQKYVPSDLVRELIRLGQEARVGGQRVDLTVFFSDILGFSPIAEELDPEELVEYLTEYFDRVSRVIHAHGGVVDKYLGDGIMALWGAPSPIENHAYKACETALAYQKELAEMHQQWEAKGIPPFLTKIGIHSGPCIVGNMGSQKRLNYTAVGDTVNLASRIENLNRDYDTNIMLSHYTYEQVKETFVARPIDMVTVRGRSEPVMVYELIGAKDDISQEQKEFLNSYATAFNFYQNREWKEAYQLLQRLTQDHPKDQPTAILFNICKKVVAQENMETSGIIR